MSKPGWDNYFMGIANQVATRATCVRRMVGCVIVTQDHNIVATGYNGSISGQPHCDDVGCLVEEGHCQRTVHSEVNAITQAAKRNGGLSGCIAYVTTKPCWPCFKVLCNAGIDVIYYKDDYGSEYPIKGPFDTDLIKLYAR